MRAAGLDEEEILIRTSMEPSRRQSICLVDRTNSGANLEQFKIIKRIGEGAFGKVYLVQRNTEKLYAMKCIRKDLIIEYKQIKNLESEKNILRSIDHPFLISMDFVF